MKVLKKKDGKEEHRKQLKLSLKGEDVQKNFLFEMTKVTGRCKIKNNKRHND